MEHQTKVDVYQQQVLNGEDPCVGVGKRDFYEIRDKIIDIIQNHVPNEIVKDLKSLSWLEISKRRDDPLPPEYALGIMWNQLNTIINRIIDDGISDLELGKCSSLNDILPPWKIQCLNLLMDRPLYCICIPDQSPAGDCVAHKVPT